MSALAYEPLLFDEDDMRLLSLGFKFLRQPDLRLAELIELGRVEAEHAVAQFRAVGRDLMQIGRSVTYRRVKGGWELARHLRRDSDPARAGDLSLPHNRFGVVGLDGITALEPHALAGRDSLRISVADLERKTFTFDHAGIVDAQGRVSIYGPTLTTVARRTGAPS